MDGYFLSLERNRSKGHLLQKISKRETHSFGERSVVEG
jgi:hypothetical protein